MKTISGNRLAALGVSPDKQYPSTRSVRVLQQIVPKAEMEVLGRFIELSADEDAANAGGKAPARVEMADDEAAPDPVASFEKIAAIRANPKRLGGFAEHELALLAQTMRRFEVREPVRAEPMPALQPLEAELRDLSTIPEPINYGKTWSITDEVFSADERKVLERLQRVHDDDGSATTVTLADLEAGSKDTLNYTSRECKLFETLEKRLRLSLRDTAPKPRAALVVPLPGVHRYLVPCTAEGITVRLDATVTINGRHQQLSAKRIGSLHVELPEGSVAVFVHQATGGELPMPASGPVTLPPGDYTVEVHRNGELSVGHINVPTLPNDALSLLPYAGYDFVNDDGEPLVFAADEYTVSWGAPGAIERSSRRQPTEVIGLSRFYLPPGRYQSASGRAPPKTELLVLNEHVAIAEIEIDGAVYRARLSYERSGQAFAGEVPLPPGSAKKVGSLAQLFADDRGVLATVRAFVERDVWPRKVTVAVDHRGQRSTRTFVEEDRVS
jgi:hypothetical protein